MREDKTLKTLLILQSFSPLFVLLLIRHARRSILYFSSLIRSDCATLGNNMWNPAFGDAFITVLSALWLLTTIIIAVGFRDFQKGSFDSCGESVIIIDEKKDSGATFLVTFVLPLLIDDVTTLSGLISFIALLLMIVFLLVKSGLFYQSPVLVALKYKVFSFQFIKPFNNVEANKTYIGITRGDLPIPGSNIKRRYIADNVFLIYND